MSKRFGRNQKRALVAQLAQTTSDNELLRRGGEGARSTIRQQQKDLRGLQTNLIIALEALDTVRARLGRYFAGLPPTVLEVEHIPQYVTLPVPSGLGAADIGRHVAEIVDVASMVERLSTVEGGAWTNDLLAQMHIKFKTPLGDVAYAFNHRTFIDAPKSRVINTIAEHMAEYLWHSAEARGAFKAVGVK